MNKIQKAIQRSKQDKAQGASVPTHPALSKSALSEREQLEYDIRKLLSDECPEVLGSMQKQIKLSYSKTKTIQTDRQALINKCVYALLHDIEITKRIEILRTQVLKKLSQMNTNCLMVTSANHREGKTFISTNLAVSIAQNLDRTVMLIDADLRNRPYKRHNMASIFFDLSSCSGLSDYLSGTSKIEDLLVNPGIPRLTILPSGEALAHSAEYLGSPKMEELIYEMKSKYSRERILIFDCSSFSSNADPLILSRLVDAVLLVVENERTEIKDLQRMIGLLKDTKIVGAVMNKSKELF